jgi:energy-coupling factor transport system permease protein
MPIGQYVSGSSILHRLDARLKLTLLAAYVAAVFLVSSWLGMLACVALLLVCYRIAGIPLKHAARGLAPVLVILIFTFCAHAFGFQADDALVAPPDGLSAAAAATAPPAAPSGNAAAPESPAAPSAAAAATAPPAGLSLAGLQLGAFELPFSLPSSIPVFGGFVFKPWGAADGLFFALRIVALVCATTLLTLSTSVVALTDSLAQLLRPLARLRVPTEDIAMMFSVALRFIPLIAEQAERLTFAMAARGARFGEGGPLRRVRAYVPVLIPLFVSLFRRADRLAMAMESRCYQGGNRTRLASAALAGGTLAVSLGASALLLVWGLLF